MPDAAANPPRRRRRALAVAAILLLLPAAMFALSSARRPPKLPRPLPVPNGYDDLVRAGRSIRGDWPNKGDLATADLGEVRPFLLANAPAFEALQVGLARECVASFEDSQAGLGKHIGEMGPLRSLSRLVLARARVADADGRVADAAGACVEALKLGQDTQRGGMGISVQMGMVIQRLAIVQLQNLRDKLTAEDCHAVLRELEALDRGRVLAVDAAERHGRWYAGAFSLGMRLQMRWLGLEKKGIADERAMATKALDQADRSRRFLMVELAIRAHHLERGTWPRSVEALIPAYLASAPVDPATGKVLDYPKSPEGELTDDLSRIGEPEGRASP